MISPKVFPSRKPPVPHFLPDKFASCLDHCTDIVSLRKLHACVITRGLEHNTYLGSKLLETLAKFDLLNEAKRVFDQIINDNLSLWDSISIQYFRANQHSEVLATYLNLRKKSIGIHTSSITFALKSCVHLGASRLGRNLHTDAFKFGLSHHQFLGSSLIRFYAQFDQIGDAAKVFDEITERDLVAYTSMVSCYAQANDHHTTFEALRVARDMQSNEFEPNRVTLVSLLKCASRLCLLEHGKSIHGYSLRKEISCLDEVFQTSLLDMYTKCGDPNSGARIFDKMSIKSTGSYNAMISGHLHAGQPLEAYNLFRETVDKRKLDDLFTLANGLLCCADLGYLLVGKAVHCHVIREGINLDLVCSTALINMYSKCKQLSPAMNVFSRTKLKDNTLYNAMIAGYIYNGCPSRAIETFRQVVSMHVGVNTCTIINVLSALPGNEDVKTCKSFHGYVFRQGFTADSDISNQFISTYAKFGFMGYAWKEFDRMELKDRVSWTSLMTGLVNHGLAGEAITLFSVMQRDKTIEPDCVTFTCLLQSMGQLGFGKVVREVHGRIFRLCLEDVKLMNALITAYSKLGKFETAVEVFDQMSDRDISTWNTMISAYGMHGEISRALKSIDWMKKDGLAPDGVTFKSVISACSHSGLVEEGLSVFGSMEKEYGVVPSDEHYGCVVDLLGRAGQLEEASEFLERASSRISVSTVGSLLAACRTHGDSEMGERVGKWLMNVGPENASVYCSVSNMYSGGGRWDEAASVGDVAKRKGLKRISGFSRVDL